MRPVVIESPYSGCFPLNRAYLAACIRDAISRRETPYCSHGLLTWWVLDDTRPEDRAVGLDAAFQMTIAILGAAGSTHALYVDLGESSGMLGTVDRVAKHFGFAREYPQKRTLPEDAWFRIYNDACAFDPLFRRLATQGEMKADTIRKHLIAVGQAWTVQASPERKSAAARGIWWPL